MKEVSMTRSRTNAADAHNLGSNLQHFTQLGDIRYRSVAELKRYANNPRRHSDKQLVKLEASIREFGFMVPVLIDRNDEIIAGEARVEAARRARLGEVPTICAEHLSPAQIKAFRLADNKLAELATWDTEALAIEIREIMELGEMSIDILGFDTAEIDVLFDGMDAVVNADPADVLPELPAQPVSCTGDMWLLGKHRLLVGSSLDGPSWAALMNGGKAVMAFTDPPYNVRVNGHVSGLGKHQHDEFAMASGELDTTQFITFLTTFLGEMTDHLVDGAIADVCIDWRHLPELLQALTNARLSLINLCVWNKNNGGMGSLYRSKHELVLIAKKGKAAHINNVELGKNGRYRTNVWDYAGANSFGATRDADLAAHPTVKPVALVADAIRDVTRHGDIVLDAFMGSGTTLLAAERTGRIARGIEIDPRYVDVAIKRWQTMTGKEACLESSGQSFTEVMAERLLLEPILAA
jgi:DNA modification methylase